MSRLRWALPGLPAWAFGLNLPKLCLKCIFVLKCFFSLHSFCALLRLLGFISGLDLWLEMINASVSHC